MKLSYKFIIFSMVGLIAFLIDISVFNLFYSKGFNYSISLAFGVGISMIFNFSINRNFTFNARGNGLRMQIIKWLSVYGVAFLAREIIGNSILFTLGEDYITVQIAYFVGILIAIPIDFFGSLLWAFKKKSGKTIH